MSLEYGLALKTMQQICHNTQSMVSENDMTVSNTETCEFL